MRGGSGKRRGERGQALIIFVLALAVLLGFTALVIDVGLAFQERRNAQNGADAAALAAAQDLRDGAGPVTAAATARDYLQRHGYQSPDDTVTVNIPPTSGSHIGDPFYVEVIVETEEPPVFRAPLTSTVWTIRGRAVATFDVSLGKNAAILTLSETECQSFEASGTASLTINNDGGIVANSNCDPSLYRNGSGTISAEGGIYYYDEGGGYDEVGPGAFDPPPDALPNRIEDPLAYLVPPDFSVLGKSPDSGGPPPAPKLKKLTAGTATLRPGVYYGGLEIGSSANVTFEPGIYVMAGGGFKIGGSANATGIGITVYNSFDPEHPTGAGACGSITLVGTSAYNLVAPTSGPYEDLLFWQDRACTNGMSFNGNGDNVGGVIYVPTGEVELSGTSGLGSIQIIADTVDVSGTGSMTVEFYPYISVPIPGGLKLAE